MPLPYFSLLTEDDLYLFNEGSHFRLHHKLGAHPAEVEGKSGTYFAVWAPDAEHVSVIGDFNNWDGRKHKLSPKGSSGIWEGFLPGVERGSMYKYQVRSRYQGYRMDKLDPYGFYFEVPPRTASIVWDLEYAWNDREWMQARRGGGPASATRLGLRNAHRLLAAGARGGQPFAFLPGTGRHPSGIHKANGLHPCGIPAGDGASRFTDPGAIRPPATSRRPAATARRRISSTWSMCCIRTGSG